MNTPAKWVNTEPDAGATHALLERLAQSIPPSGIDEVWIFPTRRIAIGESTVFVIAARAEAEDRSRVITARYAVTRSNKGVATVQEKIDEHGTAPAGAVARIVQGVLRRMGEEGEQPPRAEKIEGESARFWGLVVELGGEGTGGTDELGTDELGTDEPLTDEPQTDEPLTDDMTDEVTNEATDEVTNEATHDGTDVVGDDVTDEND